MSIEIWGRPRDVDIAKLRDFATNTTISMEE
jgi:hypothetical protein